MPAAWIGAGASLIGGISSMASSPSVSGGGPNYYTPTGLGAADTAWQGALGNNQIWTDLINQTSQNSNQSLGLGNAAWANYGPGYQAAANAAGTGYTNAGTALTGLGNLDLGTQQSLLNAGQQVYQNSLDPNKAQYDLSLNNLMQQTGATNSMYGLGSSAAGAGVQNQALSNFGINWNTQQLQNQIAGLGAYAGAANTAGNYGQAGANALTQAPGYTLQGGQLPYTTAMGIAATPGQLGQTYSNQLQQGPFAANSGLQSSIIPYLNYGAGAQSVPFQQGNDNAQSLGTSIASGISGIGNAVQSAGTYFGSNFGSTQSPGNYSGTGFGGYGLGTMASPYYSGGGNSYGFTMS